MPLSHALRRRSRRGEGEAQPYHLNQPYTSFLSERDEGGRPRRNKRGGHQMLDPSLASAATPRFFLYPPHSGEYLRRLVSCGVQQAQRCADSDATQMERNQGHRHHDSGVQARSCGATVAQLVNPIAADMRGGLGAEVLLCAAAERHQRRTNNIDEAQVVVMCPHLHYQRLLGPGIGRLAPRCPWPDDGERPVDRIAELRRAITKSAAWNRSVPHVYMTNAEFAAGSYSIAGHPFGAPAPKFVLHANPDVWPFGLGGSNAIVPYMPAVQLMTARVRARADARATQRPGAGLVEPEGTKRGSTELLLYFRGTLDFGSARSQLASLAQQNFSGVVFDAPSKEARGASEWAHLPNERYAKSMERSTFCLVPSGHTCNTRRFFDAVAAGCIPVLVDCETAARPFDERINYAKFTLFYPLRRIVEAPSSFLRCLRRLQRNANFAEQLLQWRQALRSAREQLEYGYWETAPNLNTSLLESGWELNGDGRVLDNLLVNAVTERSKRTHPRNPWQKQVGPEDRRIRAYDLQDLCGGANDAREAEGEWVAGHARSPRADPPQPSVPAPAPGSVPVPVPVTVTVPLAVAGPLMGREALAGCWNVYVDVGTNIGVQIRKLSSSRINTRRRLCRHSSVNILATRYGRGAPSAR